MQCTEWPHTLCLQVNVRMYLIFPLLSNGTNPSRIIANSPANATDKVVARLNSPSDQVFQERNDVTFQVKVLKQGASVPLAITSDAQIQPKPNQKQRLSGFTGTVG